ncbi:MAG: hypothetical protein E6H83_00615 [Chloroflexi bacterium]|nr:MAG: hypothetical protein E6H83_00615 [Chloroflexota bacterium]
MEGSLVQASRWVRHVVCPIGFVADHREVFYHIDFEARAGANRRGIALRGTRPLQRPPFIKALPRSSPTREASGASGDAPLTRP